MYFLGGLLALVDRRGGLPAPLAFPAAGCGAAICGAGLGCVLATSVYVSGVWLLPCGSSWAGVCGAAGICFSWVARSRATSGVAIPSTGGEIIASDLFGSSMQGL